MKHDGVKFNRLYDPMDSIKMFLPSPESSDDSILIGSDEVLDRIALHRNRGLDDIGDDAGELEASDDIALESDLALEELLDELLEELLEELMDNSIEFELSDENLFTLY